MTWLERMIRTGAAGILATAASAMISLAIAQPVGCADVADPALKAAVEAGRGQLLRVWRAVDGGFVTAYRLGGGAPVPLGLDKLKGFEKSLPQADAAPIEGLLAVTALDCQIYEQGPPTGYVVRLVGRGLRFREGAAPWTPPLPRGIVQGFELVLKNGEYGARPAAELRAALPPDARLSPPPETVAAPPMTKAQKAR